ncbi:MAG: formimidoylglutamate deiminase [Actinomycetota bacterium]|nr:formimidoylglutamate deiminase [Actinomycetota bacterium]
MSVFWCELAWLGDAQPEAGVVIEASGERIEEVRAGVADPPPGSQRLDGLVIPGLANAHSHAFQRALRGRTHGAAGSFWTWREQMYELAGRLDPDLTLAVARATFAEMALAGVTLVGEFHYLHHGPGGVPYEDPNALGAAVIQAAAEAGVRLTLLDACYLHGGIGIPPEAGQRRFCDRDVEAWTARVDRLRDGPRVRIGAAIHSVRAVDPASAAVVAKWAAAREAPLHAHVSEQPVENAACLDAYGANPAAVLARAGALSQRFTAVHATHVSEADLTLLGDAGTCCCLCPTTERDLADGIGPGRRLRDAGVRLALGSDSNASIEPFEEARAVELDERLATGVRGQHTASDLLQAATANGYQSLGWPEGGAIRAGALADLVVVRREGVRLAGVSAHDALAALVFAGAAADVRHVIVGGRFVVRDGAHVGLDVAGALADVLAKVAL